MHSDLAPVAEGASIVLLDDFRTGQKCPRAKRRLWGRSCSSVDTVLVHATGVRGGFATSQRQRLDAANHLNAQPRHDTRRFLSEDEEAVFEARIARYRETPYHGLYSPRDRVSVVQWGATQVTYHGDATNKRSLGWAYDGLFKPDSMDDLDVEGGRVSLRHIIERGLEQGCPLRRISPHANHAAKPHDPGPRLWLDVVVPVANEFGLALALDWVTGNGQPWAKRWMEVAA